MSPRRWIRSAGCSASSSSRPPRPATPRLLGWLGGFGTVGLVGIEGTGSYGAGLARHITAAGVRIVEVDRSDRQDRRRQGKSDPLDAVSAARAAQSGRARGAPKGRDGAVEAVRALMLAKRSATGERTRADQPGQGTAADRARRAAHPAGRAHRGGPGHRDRRAASPPRRAGRLRHPHRAARAGPPRRLPRPPARAPRRTDRPTGHRPRPRPARPPRHRATHRRAAAHHRRRPPRAAAQRGSLGTPMCRRPHPGILRQDHPAPAQPRRRPASQPRPVAHRAHPDELTPADPRLRATPHQRRQVQDRDHPLPQALRRPRGLPAPAPRPRLTQTPGTDLTHESAAAPAGLRTIRRPVPGPSPPPAARDLIRACPPHGAAPPCLVRTPANPTQNNPAAARRKRDNEMPPDCLTSHRSRRCPCG